MLIQICLTCKKIPYKLPLINVRSFKCFIIRCGKYNKRNQQIIWLWFIMVFIMILLNNFSYKYFKCLVINVNFKYDLWWYLITNLVFLFIYELWLNIGKSDIKSKFSGYYACFFTIKKIVVWSSYKYVFSMDVR